MWTIFKKTRLLTWADEKYPQLDQNIDTCISEALPTRPEGATLTSIVVEECVKYFDDYVETYAVETTRIINGCFDSEFEKTFPITSLPTRHVIDLGNDRTQIYWLDETSQQE